MLKDRTTAGLTLARVLLARGIDVDNDKELDNALQNWVNVRTSIALDGERSGRAFEGTQGHPARSW